MVKKSNLVKFPFGMILFVSLLGCTGEESTGEIGVELGLNSASYIANSSPTQSIVITNALEPWVLVPSDLALYPLSFSAMPAASATQLQGPNGGNLRRLLQYMIGCALTHQDQFAIHWTDLAGTTHHEHFSGNAGLAPNWKNEAMTVPEQEWVSACLAARSNWYGEQVQISMRGRLNQFDVTDSEDFHYSHREGAFWGNIFAPTPFLNACFDANNVLYARSQHRDCAAGHLELGVTHECGMIAIVGPCQQVCSSVNADGYYSDCSVERYGSLVGSQMSRVITDFLR